MGRAPVHCTGARKTEKVTLCLFFFFNFFSPPFLPPPLSPFFFFRIGTSYVALASLEQAGLKRSLE